MLKNTILGDPKRILTHVILGAITLAGCWLFINLKPDFSLDRQITLGTGYVALLFLVFTLIYGPWRLMSQSKNPVNFYLRRDVGIWTAITGLLHVFYGFKLHMGGQILAYFFAFRDGVAVPLINSFGMANWTGLLATLVLILLLLLSNDLSLRMLKGKLWKFLQNFNYGLIVLVIVHTLVFQVIVKRETWLTWTVLGLAALVLGMQLIGISIYRSRQR